MSDKPTNVATQPEPIQLNSIEVLGHLAPSQTASYLTWGNDAIILPQPGAKMNLSNAVYITTCSDGSMRLFTEPGKKVDVRVNGKKTTLDGTKYGSEYVTVSTSDRIRIGAQEHELVSRSFSGAEALRAMDAAGVAQERYQNGEKGVPVEFSPLVVDASIRAAKSEYFSDSSATGKIGENGQIEIRFTGELGRNSIQLSGNKIELTDIQLTVKDGKLIIASAKSTHGRHLTPVEVLEAGARLKPLLDRLDKSKIDPDGCARAIRHALTEQRNFDSALSNAFGNRTNTIAVNDRSTLRPTGIERPTRAAFVRAESDEIKCNEKWNSLKSLTPEELKDLKDARQITCEETWDRHWTSGTADASDLDKAIQDADENIKNLKEEIRDTDSARERLVRNQQVEVELHVVNTMRNIQKAMNKQVLSEKPGLLQYAVGQRNSLIEPGSALVLDSRGNVSVKPNIDGFDRFTADRVARDNIDKLSKIEEFKVLPPGVRGEFRDILKSAGKACSLSNGNAEVAPEQFAKIEDYLNKNLEVRRINDKIVWVKKGSTAEGVRISLGSESMTERLARVSNPFDAKVQGLGEFKPNSAESIAVENASKQSAVEHARQLAELRTSGKIAVALHESGVEKAQEIAERLTSEKADVRSKAWEELARQGKAKAIERDIKNRAGLGAWAIVLHRVITPGGTAGTIAVGSVPWGK